LLGLGGLAALGGIVMMIVTYANSGTASPDQVKAASQFLDTYRQMALFGLLAASIGSAWLMWGEEIAGPILMLIGGALVMSPAYLPGILGGGQESDLRNSIIGALSVSGWPPIGVGLFLLLGYLFTQVRTRAIQGARAEALKYGKGIKEEKDIRNVFLGKCWQLPYCRKFVRERCPIYHSKRTCWKERVGCMCEESVIRNAMEGKVIPSDMVAAAKYIPKSSKLTPQQKAERCRMCVIYNEHQKHVYKASLPVTALAIAGIFALFWGPVSQGIKDALLNFDKIFRTATFQTPENVQTEVTQVTAIDGGVIPYHHILLFVIALVVLAYSIKVLELMIFRKRI
jgi:hypothetical protein